MTLRLFSLALLCAAASYAAAPDGEALFKQRCATCHEGAPQPRMPTRQEIAARTPESVYRAMFEGAMQPQSSGLTPEEGRAIARYVTGKEFGGGGGAGTAAGKCSSAPGPLRVSDTDWNGWGDDLANTRYQAKPGITAAEVPNLKLKWAFAFEGDTVRAAQPTVVGNRVFVSGSNGSVYLLDASTGCTYWKYDAGAMVRGAISIGQAGGKSVAYLGDVRATVHALDAATGQLLWKLKVEDHPVARITGAPVFYDGRVYVPVSSIEEASAMGPTYECCKFRGSIVALDAASGKQIWKSYSVVDPPKPYAKTPAGVQQWGPAGASIWSAPTIDTAKKVLYAATGNSYTNVSTPTSDAILAFDLESGSLLWSSQASAKDNFTMACSGRGANCPQDAGPDYDFGTSPILRTLPGGKRILVCGQKSGIVWGLDPDQRGKVLWQTRVGQGGALGGIEWGDTADLENAYVAVSDLLSRGENKPGGIHAVKLTTGEKVWSTPAPELHCTPGSKGCTGAQSAAISSIPGVVFSGSVDGHFRAFSTKTGEIIWDFNTVRDYETVNGVPGKGGSLDSAGPVIAGGMVFTNSGYGMWQGIPGNVLLAFAK
ncbi:MAG TPA: PQQ-binding-like beta-propeller repeat protein [Bryobacteraceae bacterium]|nr:PQQ-binding-like beta-propeller repeat protein [Bryobacteraceae bacterium]